MNEWNPAQQACNRASDGSTIAIAKLIEVSVKLMRWNEWLTSCNKRTREFVCFIGKLWGFMEGHATSEHVENSRFGS